MATVSGCFVSEAEMAQLESCLKRESGIKEGCFYFPQVPLGVAVGYIHFSIGEDQSGPK